MSTLNFNVGGDPGDDQPVLIADNPPGGTTLSTHFEGVPGQPPNRFVATVPSTITGGATLRYQGGKKEFRVIVPPGDGPWEAGMPPCIPPEYNGDFRRVLLSYDPIRVKRTGVVRYDNHVWIDDQGPFHPLGDTLLHALGTTHREGLARIEQHGAYFSKYRHDYVRLLCEVSWSGQEIDVRWSDYPLGLVIDTLYDKYGIRVKPTIIGGVSPDPLAAARVVAGILAGRQQKVLFVEMVNEGNADADVTIEMVRIIQATGVLCAVGLGNQGLETINKYTGRSGAKVGLLHTERGKGDASEAGGADARQIRQCWDLRLLEGPLREDAEGPGPGSSVATLDDPFKLAVKACLARICGAGAYCDHTGSGVFGRPMDGPYGHRYANVWEIPNMDQIMEWTRNADALLPLNICNWAAYNNGHIVETKDGECNKHYGARNGNQWVQMPIGCPVHSQTLTARQATHLKVYNPATKQLLIEKDLAAGGTVNVSGLWAYLLVGVLP